MFSIQTWLGESEDSQKSGGTPGYFSVGMSGMFPSPYLSILMGGPLEIRENACRELLLTKLVVVMALAVTYLPLFIPPPGAKTTPPPPVPLQ